jgi:hypothetical protein
VVLVALQGNVRLLGRLRKLTNDGVQLMRLKKNGDAAMPRPQLKSRGGERMPRLNVAVLRSALRRNA